MRMARNLETDSEVCKPNGACTCVLTRCVKTLSSGSVDLSCLAWAAEGCFRPDTMSRLLRISPVHTQKAAKMISKYSYHAFSLVFFFFLAFYTEHNYIWQVLYNSASYFPMGT
jgi:hypothetical protein